MNMTTKQTKKNNYKGRKFENRRKKAQKKQR